MTDSAGTRPTRGETTRALLLAALCSLLFLGEGLLPSRAVVPYPPELFQPARAEVLSEETLTWEELDRGNAAMGDKYNQSLAWDRILQDRLRQGELPLWTRDIAGGAPFVPQMAQVYQPWNLLLVLPIPSAGVYGVWFFLHQVLFGVFAWWFLRKLGLGQPAALFGLCCAVLGLWTQARVHHNVILTAALPLFPLLSLVHHAFRGGGSGGDGGGGDGGGDGGRGLGPGRIALVALCTGLSWSGGFPPVSLQTTYLVVAWAVFLAVRERRARPLVGIAAGLALGGVLALAQMGPTLLAASLSSRTSGDAGEMLDRLVRAPLSWQHLKTLLWPDLLHWPDLHLHHGNWGPAWAALEVLPGVAARESNYPETAFALGAPALLLVLAALRRPEPRVLFFLVVAALAFGLATASTPFLQLSAVIPGARTGDLRRFLFLVSVALTVVAAHGAERAVRLDRPRVLATVAAALLVLSLVPLVQHLVVAGDEQAFRQLWAERLATHEGVSPELALSAMAQRPWETPANLGMLLWTYGRSSVLAAAMVAVLLLVHRCLRVPALIALTILELVAAGRGTIVPVDTERVTEPPRVLAPVLASSRAAANGVRPRLFRLEAADADPVLELLPPNLGAYHGVEDLGSYNPLPPLRMEELFLWIEPDAPQKPSVTTGGAAVLAFYRPESLHHPLLDLLGVRFVLSARDDLPAGPSLLDRTPAGVPAPFRLYERTGTLPRATFVDRAEVVEDLDERRRLLGDPGRDPRPVVILEEPDAPRADGDGVPDAEVEVLEHRDEVVRVAVHTKEPGYLRLADPCDPGWTARVDGEPRPVWIADHYLRAVHLEPGEHVVEFRYDAPLLVLWPRRLAGLALLGVVALGAVAVRRRRRPQPEYPERPITREQRVGPAS